MTLDEYQELAERTENKHAIENYAGCMDVDRLLHAIIGIHTEGGEIATSIKAHAIYNKPLDVENVCEEIGDLLWYVALLANATGLSLDACMSENIAKLRKRYPEKYSDLDAIKRADKADGQ